MLRNIKIGQRLTLFFCILGVVTLLIGVFSINQISVIAKNVSYLGDQRLPQVIAITDVTGDMLALRLESMNMVGAPDDATRKIISLGIDKIQADYDGAFARLQALVTDPNTKKILEQIIQTKAEYDQHLDNWVNLTAAGDTVQAARVRATHMRDLAYMVTDELDKMKEVAQKAGEDTAEESKRLSQHAITSISSLLVGVIVLFIVIAIFFTRSLVKPLKEAVLVAQRIASGDFSKRIADEGKDEAAQMMQALEKMQNQLRETLDKILSSSEQLAATSEELSAVTSEANKNMHSQEDQLEQAVTALNELTSAVDEVARNAGTTSEDSDKANAKAQIGQRKLEETVETIRKLADEVQHATSGIISLESNVKAIGSVLDVIRGIAEQTNLLALNAAIEAARAGESGRGFAVVADEVRALAHRTQESTKEIEQMIGGVQEETTSTVKNMETSNKWAGNTISTVEVLAQALSEITMLIGHINEQNLSIASASEEQAAVAREIDKNLITIRDLAFQTATGANQTNSASHDLAKLAEHVNNLLRTFKLS